MRTETELESALTSHTHKVQRCILLYVFFFPQLTFWNKNQQLSFKQSNLQMINECGIIVWLSSTVKQSLPAHMG